MIIVVEDKVLQRIRAVEILIDAGFEVIEAADVDQALAILQLRAADVGLMFTDVRMPGLLDVGGHHR